MTKAEEAEHYDSPSVISYRVGQLEKTVASGFMKLDNKLEIMQTNFVTKGDLESIEKHATVEHEDIRSEVEAVKKEVHEIKKWKDSVIGKIAAAAVIMLVMMVLAIYGLDKFFKP